MNPYNQWLWICQCDFIIQSKPIKMLCQLFVACCQWQPLFEKENYLNDTKVSDQIDIITIKMHIECGLCVCLCVRVQRRDIFERDS